MLPLLSLSAPKRAFFLGWLVVSWFSSLLQCQLHRTGTFHLATWDPPQRWAKCLAQGRSSTTLLNGRIRKE